MFLLVAKLYLVFPNAGIRTVHEFFENGGEVLKPVSFVDSKVTVTIDFNGDFGNFDNGLVTIEGTAATAASAEAKKDFDLTATLCGVRKEGPYKVGQRFELCVKPDDSVTDYHISGFKNVVCQNQEQTRTIVNSEGEPDALTEFNWEDDATKDKAIGFSSVVTAGFFSDAESTDPTSFTCSGSAVMKYSGNRMLTGSIKTQKFLFSGVRSLQASKEDAEGVFAAQIAVVPDSVDFDVFAAPGVAAATSTIANVAGILFLLAAALL